MLRNYTYLNSGLTIMYNGRRIISRNGLEDPAQRQHDHATVLYPIIHLKGEDIEIAFTHTNQYGEEYHSFVNGQHTTQGGTHQSAFKKHIAETIKEFFGKNYEYGDIRNGIVAAIAINVEEPVFESQTKVKLGSLHHGTPGWRISINKYVGDFIKHRGRQLPAHPTPTSPSHDGQKIKESERERKAMAGVTKLARERAKKANLHNRKLRDCRIHYNDAKDDRKRRAASSSPRATRPAVPSPRAATSTRRRCSQSARQAAQLFRPLQEGGLRERGVQPPAGCAQHRGRPRRTALQQGHRRHRCRCRRHAHPPAHHHLLPAVLPELIKKGHVYILQTPLFRVRNRRKIKNKQSSPTHDAQDEGGEEERLSSPATAIPTRSGSVPSTCSARPGDHPIQRSW
jgi:topoisomerase-4 subunit B